MFETEEEKAKIEFKNGKFYIYLYIIDPITHRWTKMGKFDRESIREE